MPATTSPPRCASRSATDGPDVVLDPLYGAPLRAALEVAAPGARIVQMGQSAGAEAELASATIRGKQLDPRLLEPGDPARASSGGRTSRCSTTPTDGRLRLAAHALPAERGRRGLRGRPLEAREKLVVTP